MKLCQKNRLQSVVIFKNKFYKLLIISNLTIYLAELNVY